MEDYTPAALAFQGIQYKIKGQSILKGGIYGVVQPGETMAIMGASGAGKTTFLDILAGKHKAGEVRGEIFVNGVSLDPQVYKGIIGFMDQEDTLMPTLTVFETITFSAQLRLPRTMSPRAREARVRDAMAELGLTAIADRRIGDTSDRGISGGEKRRVSIACELVTSPSILFLDEPTSGLDAYNAANVMDCLSTLAKDFGRTVICTIHQPRSDIFARFDRLLLLSRGYQVYSGPAGPALAAHLDRVGHPCPIGYNMADFLVDMTQVKTTRHYPSRSRAGSSNSTGSSMGWGRPHGRTEDQAGSGEGGRAGEGGGSMDLAQGDPSGQLWGRDPGGVFGPTVIKSPRSDGSDTSGQGKRVGRGSSASSLVRNPWATSSDRASINSTVIDTPDTPQGEGERDQALPGPTEHQGDEEEDPLIQSTNTLKDREDEEALLLRNLVDAYQDSPIAKGLQQEITRQIQEGDAAGLTQAFGERVDKKASWWKQFRILSERSLRNLQRNPFLLLSHYAMSVLLALLCGILFYNVSNDIAGFQNRMGVFFFVCALFAFSCLSSLPLFASERIIFMRERANGYYSPIPYYMAKVLFDILPLRVVPPLLLGAIIYPMVGLVPDLPHFARFLAVLVAFNLTAAGICLVLGIIIREVSVANLTSSLVMLFSMLFGGLLLNKDSMPVYLQWLKNLSFFHYAFEALIVNEMVYLQLIEEKYGLEIDVPGATILSTFGFDATAYLTDLFSLIGMWLGLTFFAGLFLALFVRERR